MTDQLRTDIENIPTDGTRVLVGTLAGEVFISRYIAPDSHNPNGRWPGIATNSWPVVWAPIPRHPYAPETKILMTGEKVKP